MRHRYESHILPLFTRAGQNDNTPAMILSKILKQSFAALTVMALTIGLTGCGSESRTAIDETPFKAAITQYLSEHSMGMQVTEFKELKIQDQTATALCVMKDAEGLYGMGVTWNFEFEKTDEGWKAPRHGFH